MSYLKPLEWTMNHEVSRGGGGKGGGGGEGKGERAAKEGKGFGGGIQAPGPILPPLSSLGPMEGVCPVARTSSQGSSIHACPHICPPHAPLQEHNGEPVRADNSVFVKLITNTADNERVVGAHYLGPNAGEIIQVGVQEGWVGDTWVWVRGS